MMTINVSIGSLLSDQALSGNNNLNPGSANIFYLTSVEQTTVPKTDSFKASMALNA